MPQPEADRNLLFGVLALQDDLITERQFTDVCALWVLRRDRPLAELLVERGWIAPADRDQVEQRLARKIQKHGGDIRASLAEAAGAEVRDVIRRVESPVIRHSLQMLPPAATFVRVETLVRPAADEQRNRYTLSRLHAEGGLGKVWVARDTDLNREVALKEIRADQNTSPEASIRFLKEAQVTGQLEHPNIVPVYELGRRPEDNQPFYTMRFVRGQTLRDAIEAHHEKRDVGNADALGRQKLLSALVSVCQAIAYAHSRGVIHRDLKPDNVVLGAFGEVVVLDWGLAKVVDEPEAGTTDMPSVMLSQDANVKATHGIVGTPAYMAPEQAEGHNDLVDARSDVYGLGAILFEILTGRPPVEGDTVQDVLRQVTSREPRRAREVDPEVPRALDAVCAKALAKRRADRYQKAVELADDLQRWMADEPVTAYQDPLSARLFRWARRHRPLVAGAAALLATATVALSVSLVLINDERNHTEQQRQLAVGNAKKEEKQRAIAEAKSELALHNLRLAQDAADGLLGEVADVDLADIPQMEGVRQRLLEKAQTGFREFLKQQGSDPLVQWGAGRSLVRLGDIQALLGQVADAETSFQQALTILERLVKGNAANADFQRDIARAEHGLGVLLKDVNRFEPAETHLRRAVALRTELGRGDRARPDDRQALADSRYQLGALLARRGARGTADADAYRAALEVQETLARQYANRPDFESRLARYRNNFGMLQRASGQPATAEKTFRETLELLEPSLARTDPLPGPRWQAARAASNLGVLLMELNRPEEADERLTQAHALLSKLCAEFPKVAQYHVDFAAAAYNRGLLAKARGRGDAALALFREAADTLDDLARKFPKTPVYRQKLAVARLAVNGILAATAPEEAETALRQALAQQMALLDAFPDIPEYQDETGRTHHQLAHLLASRGKHTDALRETDAAEALYEKALRVRPDSNSFRLHLFEARLVRGITLLSAHRLSDARAVAERLYETVPGEFMAYIQSAALLARCADASTSTDEGKAFAEAARSAAVSVLRRAVERRLIKPSEAKEAFGVPEFKSLRDREDFQRVLQAASEPPRQA